MRTVSSLPSFLHLFLLILVGVVDGTLKVGDVVRVTKTVDPDVRKIDLDAE